MKAFLCFLMLLGTQTICTDWKRPDPAQDSRAVKECQEFTYDCDIGDRRNTHGAIPRVFRNGDNRGQNVEDLTCKYITNATIRAEDTRAVNSM